MEVHMGPTLRATVITISFYLSQLVRTGTILLRSDWKSRKVKRSFLLALQGYRGLKGI